MNRSIWMLTAAAMMCLASQAVAAPKHDAAFYAKYFDRFTRVIADVGTRDSTKAVRGELEQMRTWIGQAQAFLAAERFEQVALFLERIEAKAGYVDAKVSRIDAEQAADRAEAEAQAASEAVKRVKEQTDAIAEELRQLENQER